MSNHEYSQRWSPRDFLPDRNRSNYERKYPDFEKDEIQAWVQMNQVVAAAAKGKLLPSHQFSPSYDEIYRCFGDRNRIYVMMDRILSYDGKNARSFTWTNSKYRFVKEILEDSVGGKTIKVSSLAGLWDPENKSLVMGGASYHSAQSGNLVETEKYCILAGNCQKDAEHRVIDVKNYAISALIGIFYDGAGIARLEVGSSAKKIRILADIGWVTLDHLVDLDGLSPNTFNRIYLNRIQEPKSGKRIRDEEPVKQFGWLQPEVLPVFT